MRLQLLLRGIVCSGTGEGKYYMGLKHYLKEFEDKLGLAPYPGTLNLRLSSNEVGILEILKKAKAIVVKGFKEGEKYFGAVRCFKANMKGLNCWLIIPEKTRHKNIVEIISGECLREKFKLKDGDEVDLEVC